MRDEGRGFRRGGNEARYPPSATGSPEDEELGCVTGDVQVFILHWPEQQMLAVAQVAPFGRHPPLEVDEEELELEDETLELEEPGPEVAELELEEPGPEVAELEDEAPTLELDRLELENEELSLEDELAGEPELTDEGPAEVLEGELDDGIVP